MEFSRQEYRNELPFPSPEDLPDPGIEPVSPALQADSLPSEPPGSPFPSSNQQSSLCVYEFYFVLFVISSERLVLILKIFKAF